MADLIDRQAAIDAFTDEIQVTGRANAESVKAYVKLVVDRIKRLPSAQPEIIRCKDCKWSDWYTAADGHRYCYCMETGNGGRTEDDFCSYAERQEE